MTAAGRKLLHIHGEAMREPILAIEAEARAPLLADIAKWADVAEKAHQNFARVARLLEETLAELG